MGPPFHDGSLVGIVVAIVILGKLHIVALSDVAAVFLVERVRRILQMAGDEELAAATGHHHADAALLALGKYGKVLAGVDVFATDFGVAAMGHVEEIVEAAEDGQLRLDDPLGEDAKLLLLERILGDAIIIVESGLGSPADVERALHVGLCPVEDGLHLVPVGDVLEGELLYGGARDNHTVELLRLQHLEVLIEHHHVLYGRILRGVAFQLHKRDVKLQGRIRQQSYEVGFGRNLQRHQVQDDNLQRTDVLRVGAGVIHHEDVLLLQDIYRGKSVGYS